MNYLLKGIGVRSIITVMLISSVGLSARSAQEPKTHDATIDARIKTETLDALEKDLRENYVFPDTGEKLAQMIEDHKTKGNYNSITSAKEFADLVTKQMRDIAHDGHLYVVYTAEPILPPEPEGTEQPSDAQRDLLLWQKDNYRFETVTHLDGNIGYLKLNGFSRETEQAGPTVVAAMAFLANTDAMIIDLRENHGGNAKMVDLLASYFFSGDQPVHLNDLEWRKAGTRDYVTTQWWVLPYVPGQRYVNKEVYILTSHRTFSAAEEFTYDLQALSRATVIGEPTGGGANPKGWMRLGDHFGISMPLAHAVNPVTHTNWEGVGVKPDVEAPQQDALKVAEKTALEHLMTKTTDPQFLRNLKSALAKVETEPEQQKPQ